MHFDDGLANDGGPKECPERNEEVATGNPGQVKQRVGNLHTTSNDKTDNEHECYIFRMPS